MKKFFLGFFLAAFLSAAFAQEQVTVPTPLQTDPGATVFRPTLYHEDVEVERVMIRLREVKPNIAGVDRAGNPTSTPDFSGKFISVEYVGAQANNVMNLFNTSNFTVNSRDKRVIQRLIADGKVPSGTITGAPR